MNEQECFCVNLNILDEQRVWDRLEGLYVSLPGWKGLAFPEDVNW